MFKRLVLSAACVAFCFTAFATADEATKGHRFLTAGSGTDKVAIVGTDGKIEWSIPGSKSNDAWRTRDGKILFSTQTGAKMVDMDKNVLWSIEATDFEGGGEIQSVSPLHGGKILVAVNGTPSRIVEMTTDGKIEKEITFDSGIAKAHGQMRAVRKTREGTYLYSIVSGPTVFEIDGEGELVRKFTMKKHAFVAVRLPSGNTLIAGGDGHELVEFDKDGKEVWRVDENDIADHPLRFVAGVQRLENGNTVIANWQGHGHTGEQAQLIEITPEKELVWEFFDYDNLGNLSTIQVLDVGRPVR